VYVKFPNIGGIGPLSMLQLKSLVFQDKKTTYNEQIIQKKIERDNWKKEK
jgi:hypothetical protein